VYVYVRPHEIDVVRRGRRVIPARVRRLRVLGPEVRVEAVVAGSTQTLDVSLSRERAEALGLAEGEAVDLDLRTLRIFPDTADHYSI